MTLLIFGCGYSGGFVARRHLAAGGRVVATVRSPDKAEALARDGITARIFSSEHRDDAILDDIAAAETVLVSVPPAEGHDPVLSVYSEALARAQNLRWLGYLSTTGVYGDCDGAWVDETTPTAPHEPRSIARANVEQAWRDFGAQNHKAVHLFRIAGIYGPRRNALAQLRAGTAQRVIKPGHVFNRIHAEDIAQIVCASMRQPRANGIYNLSDDEPAPIQDVVSYAADLLGIAPPPEVAIEDAGLSPMAMSFYSECKRVSSKATQEELGLRLLYPTYREGLRALHDAGEGVR